MDLYKSKNYQALKVNYTNDLYGCALKKGGCIFLTGSCPTPTSRVVYEKLLNSFVTDNKFCSYNTGSTGIKKEIGKYLNLHSHLDTDVDKHILITLGATTFLQQLYLYLLDENSDCLMITPTFQDYYNQVRFTRASISEVAMEEKAPDWPLDIDKVRKSIRNNTRLMMLCNPNNPTGKVYSGEELTELGRIAKQNNILLVADEAYNYLIYEGQFTSVLDIPEIRNNVVAVRTFSKEFSMCGWRVGYAYLPEEIQKELFHLQLSFNTVAPSISQKAAEISLQSEEIEAEAKKEVLRTKEKRNFVTNCIDEIGHGLSYIMPKACPYLIVKYTKDVRSYDLCKDMISKASVIVSPGIGNGESGEHHFCVTFADCMEVITEGMGRLKYYFSNYY